jgi:2'-5' RNA ligase
MKRIFTAIKVHPGEEFLRVFEDLKNNCRRDRITWVDPKNIHLTLKFFGETEEERIPAISSLLSRIAGRFNPFEMRLKGTGVFGSAYKPRVVWIGIDKNPVLISLGQEIIDSMESLGFKKDRQNFVPHLTLGRIKHIDDKKRFAELIGKYKDSIIATETVNEICLIESKLTPKGPLYKVLDRYDMKREEHLSI